MIILFKISRFLLRCLFFIEISVLNCILKLYKFLISKKILGNGIKQGYYKWLSNLTNLLTLIVELKYKKCGFKIFSKMYMILSYHKYVFLIH